LWTFHRRDFAAAPRGFSHVVRVVGHIERVGSSNFRNRRDLARGDFVTVLSLEKWSLLKMESD